MNKRILFVATLCPLGMAFAFGQQEKTDTEVRAIARGERPEFVNAPGKKWVGGPQEYRAGRRWGGASQEVILSGYSWVEADGGGLRIFSVQAGLAIPDAMSFRVVVFDNGGTRYEPRMVEAGGLSNAGTKLNNAVYVLDRKVLAPDKVAYLGVEWVEPSRNP